MPSNAGHRDDRARPEFVLGDRYGTSCVDVVADIVEETLRGLGYTVSRNKPYAGGFITEHYGNPAAGLHAIQLEINRALYMDERRYERARGFAHVAAAMDVLARQLGTIPLEDLRPYRAAAAE
jgi:N-formylglutamate deformylase